MTMSRALYPVSTKAILLSPDGEQMLAMKYLWEGVRDQYGLPGGHLEADENPDDAIIREVKEELGITVKDLKREDFWLHKVGKIVLVYSGVLDNNTPLMPSQPKGEIGVWIPIKDIADDVVHVGSYKEVILRVAT